MTNYDFEGIAKTSEKTATTIRDMIDELEISECERTIYKNLLMALVRSERLNAAVKMQEYYIKNKHVL